MRWWATAGPASTPPLAEMWAAWHEITAASNAYLETVTEEMMTTHITQGENESRESIGTMLQRVTYHYWFHTGEAHAVRQQLGHTDLPQFVGNMSTAVYQPA